MRINYEFAATDHVPFTFVNVGNIPALLPADDGVHEGKIEWSNLAEEELQEHYVQSNLLLINVL